MKRASPLQGLVLLVAVVPCWGVTVRSKDSDYKANPIAKLIEIISNVQQTIIDDGAKADKTYRKYVDWCDDSHKEKMFEIGNLKQQQDNLKSLITKSKSQIEGSTTKITDLTGQISIDTADIKAMTLLRNKEHADYQLTERTLAQAVDMLEKAVNVLEREAKDSTSLVEAAVATPELGPVLEGLVAVADAASFPAEGKQKLAALLESQMDEGEDATGAPSAKAYKFHSRSVIGTLEDLKDAGEAELSKVRKVEVEAKNRYEVMKLQLTDAVKAGNEDMAEERATKSSAEQAMAKAKGDLALATKARAKAEKILKEIQTDCIAKASAQENSIKGRTEELKVLAETKKIIQASTGGAEKRMYNFLQVKASSRASEMASSGLTREAYDRVSDSVMSLMQQLAREHPSVAMEQLTAKVHAVFKYGSAYGADPFKKVKGLIKAMIDKLAKEAADEAAEKEFCDKEMSQTKSKKKQLEDQLKKIKAEIDKVTADSAQLKQDVKDLQAQVAKITAEQNKMDAVRKEEHNNFVGNKADLEQALQGVRGGLKLLRDYYSGSSSSLLQETEGTEEMEEDGGAAALTSYMEQPEAPATHKKSSGPGANVIGLLEVIESDMAQELAKAETAETDAQQKYDLMTQSNKVDVAGKNELAKLKTQDYKQLDKRLAMELSYDRDVNSDRLSDVNDYWQKLKDRCIAKPDTFAERMKRREAEIGGLKEALAILQGEDALLQGPHASWIRQLRGSDPSNEQ